MIDWIKKNKTIVISILVTISVVVFLYGCESKTRSLSMPDKKVSRIELQYELDQFIRLAELGMVDLDRQDALRAIIIQNALMVVQGQPFNPFGLITAFAAVYGVTQGGQNITRVVKKIRKNGKVNNGTA